MSQERSINSFRASRAIQAINDETVDLFSKELFNRLSGEQAFQIPDRESDLFALLGPEDCEDLVGIYLQHRGFIIYPGTCKTDLQQYEFFLVDRQSGRQAGAQVKQGSAPILLEDYAVFPGEVFVFQTDGCYEGQKPANVTMLQSDVLRAFAVENWNLMTGSIREWLRISRSVRGGAASQKV